MRPWVSRRGSTAPSRRCRRGTRRRSVVVYRHVQPPLLRYLTVLVGPAEAEDVASEAWAQAFRDLDRFSGDADGFRGWITTIGRNRALDHLRHARRRPVSDDPVEDLVDLPDDVDVEADTIGRVSSEAVIRLIGSPAPRPGRGHHAAHGARLRRPHRGPHPGQAPRRRARSRPTAASSSWPSESPRSRNTCDCRDAEGSEMSDPDPRLSRRDAERLLDAPAEHDSALGAGPHRRQCSRAPERAPRRGRRCQRPSTPPDVSPPPASRGRLRLALAPGPPGRRPARSSRRERSSPSPRAASPSPAPPTCPTCRSSSAARPTGPPRRPRAPRSGQAARTTRTAPAAAPAIPRGRPAAPARPVAQIRRVPLVRRLTRFARFTRIDGFAQVRPGRPVRPAPRARPNRPARPTRRRRRRAGRRRPLPTSRACAATYQASADRGASLDSAALAALTTAAGGVDRIATYCVDLVGAPSDRQAGPSPPKPRQARRSRNRPRASPGKPDKPGKPGNRARKQRRRQTAEQLRQAGQRRNNTGSQNNVRRTSRTRTARPTTATATQRQRERPDTATTTAGNGNRTGPDEPGDDQTSG